MTQREKLMNVLMKNKGRWMGSRELSDAAGLPNAKGVSAILLFQKGVESKTYKYIRRQFRYMGDDK